MKLLFTADIHLKLGAKNIPVEWAKNRYSLLWKELERLQHKTDIIIIGGDIFDKLPNMEELELYFDMINHIHKPCFIIPGNHESVKKATTFLTNLKTVTYNVNKLVNIIDDFYSTHELDFIPYNKLKQYYPQDIDFHNRILITHVRGEIPPHVQPEINLDLLDRWDVVLAGDLHSYENSQRNILYPGSPLTTSFHRSKVETGVIILDTETLDHTFVPLNLPQLLKVSINVGDPMPATDYHHTIYELQGNLAELAAVEDSELIDKKLTRRDIDTALILTPEMTLRDEISEFLLYILELDEKTVKEVLEEYNNYENKIS